MGKLKLLPGAPNEIAWSREFDAPRHHVQKAMSTPELLQRWLGGVRAEVLEVEVDQRVGGRYRYELRALDGRDFALEGEFLEISADRVVQTQRFDGQPGEARVTTTWAEADGGTAMKVVIAFESKQVRDLVAATGMAEGAGESYDALDDLLAEM